MAYLLLYELKQGASIHILAREVRGAAEDKGIWEERARRGGCVGRVKVNRGGSVWQQLVPKSERQAASALLHLPCGADAENPDDARFFKFFIYFLFPSLLGEQFGQAGLRLCSV